ncbi:MAG: glycosyltransferase family 39 protein, partial [Deltaproteobacteria bacterium]|nr:glycosyltransferase family 39 protein [Deltaproteobacteria bacterium]
LNTLFIAAFFKIFGNWVTAATAVSVCFGTLTLLPLFGLARTFFHREIAALVTLVYAMTPMLVDGSVDIVRDPVYWFFAVLGFYLFTRRRQQTATWLLLSSCAFLLATSMRIEAIVFLLVVPLFIFLDGREYPLRRTGIFLLPVVLILLAGIGGQIWLHSGTINWYRLTDIHNWILRAFSGYENLRLSLKGLIRQPPAGIPVEFFHNVKNILWFIGFGVVFQNALETFFYPFVPIYLIGLVGIRQRLAEDRRGLFFVLSVTAAFVLLYFFVFIDWQMENRWLALALLPSFLFLGFGMEKLVAFSQRKFSLKKGTALVLIGLLILLFTLPKNMQARGDDKVIYKTIGETIANREGNSRKIEIMTLGVASRWVLFYANQRFPGAPCPDEYFYYYEWIGDDYNRFVDALKTRGMKYLVWEERTWPKDRFDFIKSPYERDFMRLGSWSHPDTGEIVLFELR